MGDYDRINFDKRRASALGWKVVDQGWQPGGWVVDLRGGLDDGHPVHFRIYYRQGSASRPYQFRQAFSNWFYDEVRQRITTQKRLWQLVEAYAPKKED